MSAYMHNLDWNLTKLYQLIAYGVRKSPIDFQGSMSKIKFINGMWSNPCIHSRECISIERTLLIFKVKIIDGIGQKSFYTACIAQLDDIAVIICIHYTCRAKCYTLRCLYNIYIANCFPMLNRYLDETFNL